ncbi:ribosomal protein L7/L12 [Pseudomonas frederiksbergensis]
MSTDEQEAAAYEETEFVVVLLDAGVKKTDVIKAIRESTGLGLKEAKAIVDAAPAQILTVNSMGAAVAKQNAETIKKILEEAGAKVEIR